MTPSSDLVDAVAGFAETRRLLAEHEAELVSARIDPDLSGVRSAADDLRAGRLHGALWIGPKDEAVGLALWDPPSELGRRGTMFLERGYRNAGALGSFLDRLTAAAPRSPWLSLYDGIPGVSLETQRGVMEPRGYFRVERIDLEHPLDAPVPAVRGPVPMRRLRPDDREALVRLMAEAYADNPTEWALFAAHRDRLEDARVGIGQLLGDRYGAWLPEASFGVDVDGRLVAATLVNDFHGPILTEVMVDPAARRQGFGGALTLASVSAVRELRRTALRLVVTTRNERAHRLYRRLGFVPVPGHEGGLWLNLRALGVPAPTGPTVD